MHWNGLGRGLRLEPFAAVQESLVGPQRRRPDAASCPRLAEADAAPPAHPSVNLQKPASVPPQRSVILDAELCEHARPNATYPLKRSLTRLLIPRPASWLGPSW